MATRQPTVEADPGKARKRAVGVALIGVMGAALAYDVVKLARPDESGRAVQIYADAAACAPALGAATCERAFSLARQAHAAHAPVIGDEAACLGDWAQCESADGRFRPAMAAVGIAREGRRLIARALARRRAAAVGDYVTAGVGEATDPASHSSSSGGGGRSGIYSSSSPSSADSSVTTHSGGGESVSAHGSGAGAGHGVARGGFGVIGHGFSGHGG